MHWVYHPEQEAKIVNSAEYPVLLREGWYDSPEKFPVMKKKREKVKKEEVQTPLEV